MELLTGAYYYYRHSIITTAYSTETAEHVIGIIDTGNGTAKHTYYSMHNGALNKIDEFEVTFGYDYENHKPIYIIDGKIVTEEEFPYISPIDDYYKLPAAELDLGFGGLG